MSNAENNEADAYRHFTWSFEMASDFGQKRAKAVGDIHESVSNGGYGGNSSSRMDLWNNDLGRRFEAIFPSPVAEGAWWLAVSMNLTINSPEDPRLTGWNYSGSAIIPDWASKFLQYAVSQGWDANQANKVYQHNVESVENGSYYK
jgi:hypothetical protein